MTSDPSSSPFQRGLAELAKYLYDLEDAALGRAIDAFETAASIAPDEAAHWTALGFVLDAAGLSSDALRAFQTAARLDPDDHEVEVYVLTLLSESGAEAQALAAIDAAAERKGVALGSLRRDLAAAGMPVESRALILNAFIRPRNFVKSRLEDEIERAERMSDPARWERLRDAERRECSEMQNELRRDIDPQRVPADFRMVTPWAIRLGVGDDFCRGWLVERLTDRERLEVRRVVTEYAGLIQNWLDGFGSVSMPEEAAAFMYLLLSMEEMDSDAL